PGGAGVLALDTDGGRARLQVPGVIDDQHTLGVAELVDDERAQVVTNGRRHPRPPRPAVAASGADWRVRPARPAASTIGYLHQTAPPADSPARPCEAPLA